MNAVRVTSKMLVHSLPIRNPAPQPDEVLLLRHLRLQQVQMLHQASLKQRHPGKAKPVEETLTPSMEPPVTAEPTPSSRRNFKEEWISPFNNSALIVLSAN